MITLSFICFLSLSTVVLRFFKMMEVKLRIGIFLSSVDDSKIAFSIALQLFLVLQV